MAFYLWVLRVLCVVNLAPSTVYCITSTGAPKLLTSGTPWQREMKSSDCGDEEFFHNGFCCDKCRPGYFMRSPCVDSHKKTLCGPCPPSSYNALPNYARSCRRCTQCYTDFGQIMLQECLQIQDTHCGCPDGTYRSRDDEYFSCRDCAKAPLGMQSPAKCKMSSTTATTTSGSCSEGWFGTDRCFPCTRCKREKHPCNATSDAICDSTSTSDLQLAWLALLLLPLLFVVLIVTCRTLLCPRLHSFIKAAGRRQKVLVAEETQAVSGRGSHTLVVTGQAAGAVGDTNGVGEPLISPSEGRSSPLRGETSLLVGVTNKAALPILDQPLCLKALYAVSAVVPVRRWNEFVRHLGLNDSAITDANRDNPGNTSEARAEMLRMWKRARGSRATARCICNTLRSMGLDGCAEEVEVQLQG